MDQLSGQRRQETGILPLKIQLPRSGVAYRFHRLMTTDDPLAWEATYAHVPAWAPGVGFGILSLCLFPVGAMAVARFRKA